MGKRLAVLALVVVWGLLAQAQEAPPPAATPAEQPPQVAEVNQMLDAVVAAAKANDAGAFISNFSEKMALASIEYEGQNFVFRRDELADTLAGYWMGAQATKVALLNRQIRVNGSVASVSCRFQLETNALPMPLDADMRMLLMKEPAGWKAYCATVVVNGVPANDGGNAEVKKVGESLSKWAAAFKDGKLDEMAKVLSPEAFGGAVDAGVAVAQFPSRDALLDTMRGLMHGQPAPASECGTPEVVVVGSTAMATAPWKLNLPPVGDMDLQVTLLLAKPVLDWEVIGMAAGPKAGEELWPPPTAETPKPG